MDVVDRWKVTERGDAGEGTAGQDSLRQSTSLSSIWHGLPGPRSLTSLISSLHSHSAVKDWWPHFVGAE